MKDKIKILFLKHFNCFFSFAKRCDEVGIDPLETIRFQGSLNNYIRCKQPELAKSVHKGRHFIKRIVENGPQHYLKEVLRKGGLLSFHEKFIQEGFTSFQDFFCVSDKKSVGFNCSTNLSLEYLKLIRISKFLWSLTVVSKIIKLTFI